MNATHLTGRHFLAATSAAAAAALLPLPASAAQKKMFESCKIGATPYETTERARANRVYLEKIPAGVR